MKKIRATTFYTGGYEQKLEDSNVSWRGVELQAFRSPHRLLFDFVQDKSLAVQAVVQILACKYKGEAPNNVYPSFGNSPQSKRKLLHIALNPEDDKTDDLSFMNQVHLTDSSLYDVFRCPHLENCLFMARSSVFVSQNHNCVACC